MEIVSMSDPDRAMRSAIEAARRVLGSLQFATAARRFRTVWPLVNKGHAPVPRMKYYRTLTRRGGPSGRTIRRWRLEFETALKVDGPKEAFTALVDLRKGPAPGTKMPDSAKAFVLDCWINRNLTRAQTCHALRDYLEERRRGMGARPQCKIPSDSTVRRFINAQEPYGLGGDSNPLRASRQRHAEVQRA